MSEPGSPARTLCLGEALVDLICERPIDELPLPEVVEQSARACERWGRA